MLSELLSPCRVASMITQFTEGLNSCGGLWDVIRDHWEAFVPVMTQARQQPLTLDDFRLLFTVCYSTADSQLRAAEEETVAQWERVLVLIAGENDTQKTLKALVRKLIKSFHNQIWRQIFPSRTSLSSSPELIICLLSGCQV